MIIGFYDSMSYRRSCGCLIKSCSFLKKVNIWNTCPRLRVKLLNLVIMLILRWEYNIYWLSENRFKFGYLISCQKLLVPICVFLAIACSWLPTRSCQCPISTYVPVPLKSSSKARQPGDSSLPQSVWKGAENHSLSSSFLTTGIQNSAFDNWNKP